MLLIGVLNVSFVVLGVVFNTTPSGPAWSSYSDAPEGLAAYSQLLSHYGYHVYKLDTPLRQRLITSNNATVFIVNPDNLNYGSYKAIKQLLYRHDRIVITGVSSEKALQYILGPNNAPQWSPVGVGLATVRIKGITPPLKVATQGQEGSWGERGSGKILALSPFASSDHAGVGIFPILAVQAFVGNGRLIMISDASFFENQLLAKSDNAAFALFLAGGMRKTGGRSAYFDEAVHGFGQATGFWGIPSRWRWAFSIALLGALGWMWSKGHRLGPPQNTQRTLPPPRKQYVEALAATLSKLNPYQATIDCFQRKGQYQLTKRLGLPVGTNPAILKQTALRYSLVPQTVITGLFDPVFGKPGVFAAAKACAWCYDESIQTDEIPLE